MRSALAVGALLSLIAAMALYPTVARAEGEQEAPTVLTQNATGVGRTTATLNAIVNPNGSEVTECEFEYGTSPKTMEQTVPCDVSPGSGENFVIVSAAIAALKESTTYYYRIVATNEFGESEGAPAHFTTPPTAPKANVGVPTGITRTSAVLYGAVNPNDAEVTECYFQVATSPAFESPTRANCAVGPGSGEVFVQVRTMAEGLTEHTHYYYRVVAKNLYGTTYSAATKFVTPPTKPSATTEPAGKVGHTSATLKGLVNPHGENTTCEFQYGTSPAYGSTAPCGTEPGSGEDPVAVSAALSGLAEKTTYYFRIVATNNEGTSVGANRKFTTAPAPPKVQTGLASNLSANSAQLNATVNPDADNVTSCEFEWGTSAAYGSHAACTSLPGAGETGVAVSAKLAGLSENTTYDFRIVATNAYGTTFGGNAKFKTEVGGVPPTIKKLEPSQGPAAGGTTVTINGTGFTGATKVTFGSLEGTKLKVESGTKITVSTPAETTGSVPVTVTTPGGEASSKKPFKFGLPTVTHLSPSGGPAAGATLVTITGSGFAPGVGTTTFEFGHNDGTSVQCSSTTECTVVSPAGSVGTVDVRAGVGAAESKKNPPADQYTYS